MKKELIASKLYENVRKLRGYLADAASNYIQAGRVLAEIRDGEQWRHDGTSAKSFAQWCEVEMGLARSTAYEMIRVYEVFGSVAGEIKDLEPSKLRLLAPYAEKMGDSERAELLAGAAGMTWRGIRDTVRELKGKTPTDACDHSGEVEVWNKCKVCGKFFR